MKKFLLSLLCVGSMLALLPGCWCCRKTCEEPCENYCDDYDENDYCDQGHYRCGEEDGDIIGTEEQQGWEKPIYRKGTGKRSEAGYEEQQGSRKRLRTGSKQEQESGVKRKVMYKEINPGIISKAQGEGKECKFLDPRYHVANKKANKMPQEPMATVNEEGMVTEK